MKDEKLKYSCFEPSPPHDAQWIRELKQGDAEARHCLWVNTYIYAENIPRFRPVDAEIKYEAARKAYIRLIKRGIYNFSFTGAFCGYICEVVIKRIYSEVKRNQPPPDPLPPDPRMPPPPPAPWRPDPRWPDPLPPDIDDILGEEDDGLRRLEKQEEEEEQRAALQHCLAQLEQTNPLRYAVIRMFYFEGLTADEIAARLGKTRNAVHQLLHNARLNLKECLTAAEA